MRKVLLTVLASVVALAGVAMIGATVLATRFDNSIKRDNLLGEARTEPHAKVEGPLNFLLIGSNFREDNPSNGERADVIMIVHVPAGLKQAYLVSVPRDLRYKIKPYPKTGFKGGIYKIDAALNFGGMPLMSQTITELTGIKFDGAVYSRFDGFKQAVKTLGGVDMCIDTETVSIHVGFDENGKRVAPYSNRGGSPRKVPGVTPKVYHKGCQHLEPWEALDFIRQRALLPNGDYDRQRHSQQFITAVLKQVASAGTLTNPIKLDKVLREIGSVMTIDLNGMSLTDLVYGLRDLGSDKLIGLRAPSHPKMINGTSWVVEDPGMEELWGAIREGTLPQWMEQHPKMVNSLHTDPSS